MSANYPSDAAITALASSWAANPASVFAYVANAQGQMPANIAALNSFVSSTTATAATWGVDVRLLYGYITQFGGLGSHQQLTDWAKSSNYMDASGNVTYYPAAGQNFIGDIAVTGPPAATPPPTTSSTTPPTVAGITLPTIDLSQYTSNKPLMLGLAGLAALYVVNPGHWRGR